MEPVKFSFEKVTKNTIRYAEQEVEGKPKVIGTLYIQKWALGANPPAEITVTVQ